MSEVKTSKPSEPAWAVPVSVASNGVYPGERLGKWYLLLSVAGEGPEGVGSTSDWGEGEERFNCCAIPGDRRAGFPKLWKGLGKTFLQGAWREGIYQAWDGAQADSAH